MGFCMEIDSAPEMEVKNDAKPGPKPSETIAQSEAEGNAAKQLSLAWKDCGDSSTKAKITGFTPASITEGKTNKLTGTGDLSEVVTGATFDALNFPIAAGKVPVSVDLSLSSLLPATLATTKTVAKATAKSGDALFCMEIDSAPEMDDHPTEESSHAASEDGTCLEYGAQCDPKAWLPWDKCCSPGIPRTCCDLGPSPVPGTGGFVCTFENLCPSHSNEVMV